MIYNILLESGRIEVKTAPEVLDVIQDVRQKSVDKKATCIKIGTPIYNLDVWLLPIKDLAFLCFESMHTEEGKARGNLIPIDEAIKHAAYIIKNNCLAQNEEWHSC